METGTLGLPVCVENTIDTDISELCSEELVQSSETDAPLQELPTMDNFDTSVFRRCRA